jgi:hypothetical protein
MATADVPSGFGSRFRCRVVSLSFGDGAVVANKRNCMASSCVRAFTEDTDVLTSGSLVGGVIDAQAGRRQAICVQA